jgi:hypothetical protein
MFFDSRVSRKATNYLFDLLDEGVVTHEQVVEMCMAYMSERDVADMLDANELSERFFTSEDFDGEDSEVDTDEE